MRTLEKGFFRPNLGGSRLCKTTWTLIRKGRVLKHGSPVEAPTLYIAHATGNSKSIFIRSFNIPIGVFSGKNDFDPRNLFPAGSASFSPATDQTQTLQTDLEEAPCHLHCGIYAGRSKRRLSSARHSSACASRPRAQQPTSNRCEGTENRALSSN